MWTLIFTMAMVCEDLFYKMNLCFFVVVVVVWFLFLFACCLLRWLPKLAG